MKIYVVGSSKDTFLPLNDIREKFLVDVKHETKNIDFLNPWFCEITGLYHLWQNNNDDIIGLEHYRRYFVKNGSNEILDEPDVNELMNKYDVVCNRYKYKPGEVPMSYLMANPYTRIYFSKFLTYIDDEKFRAWYIDKLRSRNWFYSCNMFIGKREVINKYCDYIFDLVIRIPKEDFISMPRLMGYCFEFLFGFWLEYNGYNIGVQDVNYYEKDLKRIIQRNK